MQILSRALNKKFLLFVSLSLLFFSSERSFAFCGFYVAKADAKLYNRASQVVYVRNGDQNVISMLNDFEGDLKDFALVVPVPTVLEKDQIHVGDKALFEHLDAYSAPRLVEYFDPDPCEMRGLEKASGMNAKSALREGMAGDSAKSLGVKVEASYTVGEYDIVILSAKDSGGLEKWLKLNSYKLPAGASKALQPYVRQGIKFFVAKVNLKEQAKTGLQFLRPIQFAFDSPKFMLPIRLGMINAKGPQDLIIYVITKDGRVETTNYRTVKLPSDAEVPEYIKDDFTPFYKAMFEHQWKKEDERVAFLEYFWNMNWCDPCAADPLSQDELKNLGVFWLENGASNSSTPVNRQPMYRPRPRFLPSGGNQTMISRLHVRYTPKKFPEDLMFQETKDQQNFQGRFVLQHPWKGEANKCEQAKTYLASVKDRRTKEAETLANLTGWEINSIRSKMGADPAVPSPEPKEKWWKGIWNK